MSLDIQTIRAAMSSAAVSPAADFRAADRDNGEQASFVETIITIVAAGVAVVVVAVMAVLMGLA